MTPTATTHPEYKILETIGSTVIISMQKHAYERYFSEEGTWNEIIDGGEGISASELLQQLKA